jgi:hypothetical protein
MSLETAHAELRLRCRELVLSVGELVTIVHEDRPPASEIAVIDHLAESVSELQGAAMRAAEQLDLVIDPRTLPERMGRVDEALAQCHASYWRELGGFRPLAALRRTAREHDLEWRTWQRSVEQSMNRCETALDAAAAAGRAAWREIAELLVHYGRTAAGRPWGEAPRTTDESPADVDDATSTRRQP